MAYGIEAGVTLLLGGVDTNVYTSANITLAIAHADIVVDSINNDASAARKTAASDLIAAELLKHASANKALKGLSSDGGNSGRPAVSGEGHDYHVPEAALLILGTPNTASSFTNTTPNLSGEI